MSRIVATFLKVIFIHSPIKFLFLSITPPSLAIYLSVFKVFFIAIMSQLFEVTLPMNLH